jgi:hypothetical protein
MAGLFRRVLPVAGSLATMVVAAAPLTAQAPDPRVGLRAGMYDAQEAVWNLRVLSKTRPPKDFEGETNSDLAFSGKYAIQGNYNGWQIWDISNPSAPTLKTSFVCPASQSDVSVYKNLLFVSGEGRGGRLDCGKQGVPQAVSRDRLRGIRIFDITDIEHPRNVGNVQTCRGSHTHTVLVDPKDTTNVYIYVSGSAGIRSPEELPGCSDKQPEQDPNSAYFRIEVIRVPVANPSAAAIVSSPRIFEGLVKPPQHAQAPEDQAAAKAAAEAARARGMFTAELFGLERVIPPNFVRPLLDSIAKARGGPTATVTAADSATLRPVLGDILKRRFGGGDEGNRGPTQCHDITVYPAIGLAGGACEGYGLLIDIKDPANPRRIAAVSDSNFSYWHSATFNNDGSKVLFTDEWGGGGQAKCRSFDRKDWGANALFTVNNGQMQFQSYYKMPAAQTIHENCVAHNGSLIPVPGRDLFIQSWYQGGISLMDWTDIRNPREIAYHDRGPSDSTRMGEGGSWSVYWYNGVIVSSEIARGLDIFELTPSEFLTQNEIDAAKTVRLDYLNTQGQPKFVWPPSFARSRAYLDQLERSNGLATARITAIRNQLATAERTRGAARRAALTRLARQVAADEATASDKAKVKDLSMSVQELRNAR